MQKIKFALFKRYQCQRYLREKLYMSRVQDIIKLYERIVHMEFHSLIYLTKRIFEIEMVLEHKTPTRK